MPKASETASVYGGPTREWRGTRDTVNTMENGQR